MIKLTKQDLNNFLIKYNLHTKKSIFIKKSFATNWSQSDFACYVALLTMQQGRDLKDSIENGISWSEHSKKDILNTWFIK